MGLLDKLEKTWTRGDSWGVKKSWDHIGDAWENIRGASKSWAAGVAQMWTAAWDDDKDFTDAFKFFVTSSQRDARNMSLSSAGHGLGALTEFPVVKQIVESADAIQVEGVKRPLTSYMLGLSDVWSGKSSIANGETWKRAYRDSERVTLGQSMWAAAGGAAAGVFDDLGMTDMEAKSQWALGQIDPRVTANKEKYRSDPLFKYTSGTIDAAATIFLDPTVVLGKAGVAAKLKYISKPMTQAAIRQGKHLDYMDEKKYESLRTFVKKAPSPEAVRQRAFAGHRGGDKAATLLWDVAADDELYDATFRSLYGDVEAWDYLVSNAPRVASVTGRAYANRTIAAAARHQGVSGLADDTANALRETEVRAFTDSIANGRGAWGRSRGVLAGQNLPRLTLTSAWRTGVHNFATFGPAVFRGTPLYPVASRARYALPSARYTRFLDVNDADSVHSFRANVERAGLDRPAAEKWISMYGRASSAEARARIAHAVEDAVFTDLAQKHGFTKSQVENLLPEINKWRTGNRRVFGTARRFISAEARKTAEVYIEQGRQVEAAELTRLADEHDSAIAKGDQPSSTLVHLDEDGNTVLMPERFQVDPQKPVMLSQHADIVPMVDWRVLDTALSWHTKGPLGAKAFHAIDMTKAGLDAVSSVWKVTSLIRPGYVWRMLSDDVMRRGTMIGAMPVVMSTSRGLRNSALNWRARYKTIRGKRAIDADADEVGGASTDLTVDTHEGPVYPSFETAVADGAIGVENYYDAILNRDANTPMPDELYGLAQAHKDGILSATEFRRNALDRALRATGRGSYSDPQWQRAYLDQVQAAHVTKRQGDVGAPVMTDGTFAPPRSGYTVRRADYRPGADTDAEGRPQGLYVSNVRGHPDSFDSTAFDDTFGPVAAWGRAQPRNPLHVEQVKARFHGDNQELEGSAGIGALKALRPDEFDSLVQMDKAAVVAKIKAEFPRAAIDKSGKDSAYALLEQYAGLVARKHGHDAIILDDPANPELSEIALLSNKDVKWGKFTHITQPKDIPPPETATLVDPMTGASPTTVTPADFTLSTARTIQFDSTRGGFNEDDLYDFVADHADDLLKPKTLLHSYVTPDGDIRLSVATAKDHVTQPVKLTGGQRVRVFGKDMGHTLRGAGQGTVEVRTPHGVLKFDAAFEGAEGARFRAQASSRGPSEAWADQMADTQYSRLINESSGQTDVRPVDPHYPQTWERVANLQLGNDPVARIYLEGGTENDVLAWIHNTSEGRAYYGRLGPYQSRYAEQIQIVRAMVDTYIPDSGSDASAALRRKVLGRSATFGDFEKVRRREEMPEVHGASLDIATGGPFTNTVKKYTDKIFKVMSDLPADKASRFPFFADRYNAHLDDLGNTWATQYDKVGQVVPVEELDRVQKLARDRALADVKKYLYDSSSSLDLAAAMRLAVPFSSAIADSYLKWGVIVREGGIVAPVVNIFKIWQAPDKAGLVQDQDGNVKRYENGTFGWYRLNPKTGESEKIPNHEPKQEYITFQLPAGVAPETKSGQKMVTYLNKDVFNTFLGLPTAGPLVAVPANQMSLRNPELAEKWFMRKFVLPYGATADTAKAVVPGNVRSAYYWVTGDEDSYRAISQAVMQTEYTRYALGLRGEPPTMAEIHESAQDMAGLQYLGQFMGLSNQTKSPYQPYLDYYHQLQAKDPETALAKFYAEMGDEYKMMTASVSRNTLGLPATTNTWNQQKKFADLIAKYPDLAPLIVGREGAGAFNASVYQAQMNTPIGPGTNRKVREAMTLQESVEDAETRFVWLKYTQMMDAIHADMEARGLNSLNNKGARDLKKARDKFIEANKFWINPQGGRDTHPWFVDYMSVDRARMTTRLTGMAELASDPRIGNRDDMRGLADYLDAREQMKAEMARRKLSNLSSVKAKPLARKWEKYVFGLKSENTAFANTYDRWLDSDDLSADIKGGV